MYASGESDYDSVQAILRHHVCQKKIRDRSFGGKKIMPKKLYFATVANLQQKVHRYRELHKVHEISLIYMKLKLNFAVFSENLHRNT